MPNCNANSAASSRRSSRVSCNSYSVFSARESAASSRRSSGPASSRPGSRRGSLLVNNYAPVTEYRTTLPTWPDATDSRLGTMHESLASLRLNCDNKRESRRTSFSSPSTPPRQFSLPTEQPPTTSSGPSNSIFNTIGSGVVGSASNISYFSTNVSRSRYRTGLGPPFQRPKYRDRYFL